jgi:hypothetical protein
MHHAQFLTIEILVQEACLPEELTQFFLLGLLRLVHSIVLVPLLSIVMLTLTRTIWPRMSRQHLHQHRHHLIHAIPSNCYITLPVYSRKIQATNPTSSVSV